ncbi:MAG: hypothetical protein AUG51_23425 [Acidobacteria bacterium 13_1_20CM_3_53_8]|nr:MAG: hypothetical protein AUG51_23425 [Acidobacteria bacterium 13_1_20CM_3_53_8]
MRLVLEIVSGPLAGKNIVAEESQVVRIGRTTKADIATKDTFMSREHFSVECDGKECRLRDLKSRNGTEVNDETVTDVLLKEGDRVHAGHTDFIVHIETSAEPPPPKELADTIPPDEQQVKEERVSEKLDAAAVKSSAPLAHTPTPIASPQPTREEDWGVTSLDPRLSKELAQRRASVSPAPESSVPEPVAPPPTPEIVRPEPPKEDMEQSLASYEAATPAGRLLHILRNQPEPLMALVDAAREPALLDLLRSSGEEFQSLYKDEKNAKVAPYLVRLPPKSPLLKRMTREGWGKGWGVYLTCSLPLQGLRAYFRKTLMVATPDGMEFFSRFYDPRFFRNFLNGCTAAESEKFFGPISSYLMEDERPEILLQFTRTSRGAEKKGHLLSMPE